MGLSRLVLVNPKKFPHYEASKLAAGAESVLDHAEVVASLSEAINDCTLVLGTSVRDREVSWPTRDPRMAAASIVAHVNAPTQQAAILFGRESSGLTNTELDQCQFQIRIPANPEYSSLNLASAVQLINYEIRMQAISQSSGLDEQAVLPAPHLAARQRPATKAECEGFLEHLQNTLVALDFVKVNPPTVLMRKLTRLYNKADLTVEEIQILRGILASVDQHLTRS